MYEEDFEGKLEHCILAGIFNFAFKHALSSFLYIVAEL